ncbi:uncharacterized protein LOC129753006 [Uranotaenia lowii]|uniref:uncharacterized protein LOC129753006 n=1 Tax=Uranotaenia lowii TaxID=190385 RepID=UPI00247853B6|nr:uncharacterized protein LOC129753006 [Uranotaenia lowii]
MRPLIVIQMDIEKKICLDQKGMLRVDSRHQAAIDIPSSMKFPIILPERHRLTELIVASFHEQHFYANSETVVNELRQVYHIPKVRVVVKRIVRNCQWCKVKKVLPRVPRMAALPTPRLATLVRPFTFVGLDLFGPLTVKVGRSQVKRWVAFFTCLTIRAVHVEVVHNLYTQSCIMSIRRFIGRRGPPAEIHSDNGTNFYGASRVLQEQMKAVHDDLATTFTTSTTEWVFIPPGTSHMGGSWERMVRYIKTSMEAANGKRSLDDEALLTLTIDAEYMVNSRPLTYMPLESNESEALTPNHFLHCSSKGIKSPTAQPTNVMEALRTTLGQVNQQLDIFWHRWILEYLLTLTSRTKWFGQVTPIAEGNLVVIIDESKRNNWVRGRVVKLLPGADVVRLGWEALVWSNTSHPSICRTDCPVSARSEIQTHSPSLSWKEATRMDSTGVQVLRQPSGHLQYWLSGQYSLRMYSAVFLQFSHRR